MTGQTTFSTGRNASVGEKLRCLVPFGVHDRLGELLGCLAGDAGHDHAA